MNPTTSLIAASALLSGLLVGCLAKAPSIEARTDRAGALTLSLQPRWDAAEYACTNTRSGVLVVVPRK